MLVFYAFMSIGCMIGATYVVFRAFGPRKETLLYSRAERDEWEQLLSQGLGDWFTKTNIFGTLTSLATVYVFFIGNTRLLGLWIFSAIVTLFLGAYVTNLFTRRICSHTPYGQYLRTGAESAAALPAVFWDPSAQAIHTAALVRKLMEIYLMAVLWIDFAVFADITSSLLPVLTPVLSTVLLFLVCLAISFFTLRFGMRGVIFADLFQSPIIVLGTFVVVVGAVLAVCKLQTNVSPGSLFASIGGELLKPRLSLTECLAFAIAAVFLNSFLVLLTPAHWLRLWVFGERETRLQVSSIGLTGSIWILLILIGAAASLVVGTDPTWTGVIGGNTVVVELLKSVTALSPLFGVAFWLACMAALFSSVDAQLYALVLVRAYSPKTNALRNELPFQRPLIPAVSIAAAFAMSYGAVRALGFDLDKIVLVVLPGCLVLAPSLVLVYRQRQPRPSLLWISTFGYALIAALGIVGSAPNYLPSIAAPLFPLMIALFAAFWTSPATTRLHADNVEAA